MKKIASYHDNMQRDWYLNVDDLTIKTTQDVEPILKRNIDFQNEHDGYTPSKDMKYVAEIPNVIIEQWNKEGVNFYDKNDWPEIKRRLNSSEYQYLRTGLGRI